MCCRWKAGGILYRNRRSCLCGWSFGHERRLFEQAETVNGIDILKDILGKHRSEVLSLLLNEFDVKIYERGLKAEGKAESIIELLAARTPSIEAFEKTLDFEQTE